MNNKRHNIVDDAWEMKEESLGGAEHTLRVGLVINTVRNAMPVIIDDPLKIVVENPKIDFKNLEKDFPILLHISSKELTVAVLVVHDKDSGHLQCYPFNNINDSKHWWLYEMAFDLVPGGFIEIRPVHPLVEEFDPTKGMMDHLEALATVVGSFVHNLQKGVISVVEVKEDFTKINRKRIKNKREPIMNDWKVVYVNPSEEENSKDTD